MCEEEEEEEEDDYDDYEEEEEKNSEPSERVEMEEEPPKYQTNKQTLKGTHLDNSNLIGGDLLSFRRIGLLQNASVKLG
jgi:hypothetical protein